MHKWKTQDPFLLQETRSAPEWFYEWKNERKIGIIRDRLDPFQGVQETHARLMMTTRTSRIFLIRRRPAKAEENKRPSHVSEEESSNGVRSAAHARAVNRKVKTKERDVEKAAKRQSSHAERLSTPKPNRPRAVMVTVPQAKAPRRSHG